MVMKSAEQPAPGGLFNVVRNLIAIKNVDTWVLEFLKEPRGEPVLASLLRDIEDFTRPQPCVLIHDSSSSQCDLPPAPKVAG